MNRYPTLRVVENMAVQSRNPKYVRMVEAERGRAQIKKGIARIAANSSIDDAIACLEEQIALMRPTFPSSSERSHDSSDALSAELGRRPGGAS